MTLVLLIRHGVAAATATRLVGTADGYPLSGEGREQADLLAERLRPIRLAAVYSSPLNRCMETAMAVAETHGLEVRPDPGLAEIEYGRWTGRTYSQLRRTALWHRVQNAPSTVRFPGGESMAEAQRRAVQTVDALSARHPTQVIAAVSHADVIRLALAHYAGVHIDLFQRVAVSPGSLTALALGDGAPRILRVNDTGTLADLAGTPTRRRSLRRS